MVGSKSQIRLKASCEGRMHSANRRQSSFHSTIAERSALVE